MYLTKHQEDVLGEWRHISTHYKPRHYMEVSGQLHTPVALPAGEGPLLPIGY